MKTTPLIRTHFSGTLSIEGIVVKNHSDHYSKEEYSVSILHRIKIGWDFDPVVTMYMHHNIGSS